MSTVKSAVIKNLIKDIISKNENPDKLHLEIFNAVFGGEYNSHITYILADIETSTEVTEEEKKLFVDFQAWLLQNAANVAKMDEPLTIHQYLSLRKKVPKTPLGRILMDMHNWKKLKSDKVSAYRTVLNWWNKEKHNYEIQDGLNKKLSESFRTQR